MLIQFFLLEDKRDFSLILQILEDFLDQQNYELTTCSLLIKQMDRHLQNIVHKQNQVEMG